MAKKVLIIDDSVTQLSSLKIFFKREGFEVITAHNGVEGYIKVYKEAPDLILSDVLMPHLGGYQLCRLLKSNKETKDIPFIMLTVLDKNLDKFWGTQSGADVFLRKDYDMSLIVNSAKEIIEKMPVSNTIKQELLGYEIDENDIMSEVNKILDDELMKTTITNKFRELTDYTKDDYALAGDIYEILSAISDYDAACIFFNSPDSSVRRRLIFHEQNVSLSDDMLLKLWQKTFHSSVDKNEFRPEKITKEENLPELKSLDEFESEKEIDFYYGDVLTGKLCLYSRENLKWNKMRFIRTIKSELDLFLKVKYLYTKTRYLSITDELTCLYTRRHLKSVLSQEFARAKRYGTTITVAMVDIDDFKKINDVYGHLAGDYILKEVSKIFITALRKTDFVYRYGGEEICILMPETVLDKAYIPLERLRAAIDNTNYTFEGKKIHVTVSIGAAMFNPDLKSGEELIEKADSRLYKAKKTGKNKVVIEDGE